MAFCDEGLKGHSPCPEAILNICLPLTGFGHELMAPQVYVDGREQNCEQNDEAIIMPHAASDSIMTSHDAS